MQAPVHGRFQFLAPDAAGTYSKGRLLSWVPCQGARLLQLPAPFGSPRPEKGTLISPFPPLSSPFPICAQDRHPLLSPCRALLSNSQLCGTRYVLAHPISTSFCVGLFVQQ